MKKLMLVAATAALAGGAFAADDCAPSNCAPAAKATPSCVYAIKLNVKTTKGICASVTTKGSAGSVCAPNSTGDVTGVTVIRAKDSTKFAGWIYDCYCACDTISTGTLVLWDSKRKAEIAEAAMDTTFINVIGKKQSDAEWAWKLTGTATYDEARPQAYDLTGAGYGKYSKKAGRYTSFSGNFAGTASASYDLRTKSTECCQPSQVWKCEDLTALTDSDTVAFGTWSVKYSSSASKKMQKNGTLKMPSYVTHQVIAE